MRIHVPASIPWHPRRQQMRCYLCDADPARVKWASAKVHGMDLCFECHGTHVTVPVETPPAKVERAIAVKAGYNPGDHVPVPGFEDRYVIYIGDWIHKGACCWCHSTRESPGLPMCKTCNNNGINEDKKIVIRKWFREKGLTT